MERAGRKKERCLPIFRLSRVFGVGRDAKVFFNLQGGLTRGAVPGLEGSEEQAEKLNDAQQHIIKQNRRLKSHRLEIFRLENELRAARERTEREPETGALPDFVIIGAHKCGTTSLYHLLTRHPHVEPAAAKELQFFDSHFDKGIEWYRRCFPQPRWKDGQRSITGEATPYYLFHPRAAKRMAEMVPEARLIVLLRNPVDRAYSHYHHQRRLGRETRGFEEAIEAEKARLLRKEGKTSEREDRARADNKRSNYLTKGIYVDQLLRWSQFFDDEQMLVLKSEDFFERPADTLKLVLGFLDLPGWEPGSSKIHKKGDYEQEMDPAIRRRLEAYFEPHNRRLYEYLGMDFGW